jgi:hypothetical protein
VLQVDGGVDSREVHGSLHLGLACLFHW